MKKGFKRGFFRFLFVVLLLLLAVVYFRESIYQFCVKYKDDGSRLNYKIEDAAFAEYVKNNLPDEKFSDIHIIANLSQRLTAEHLSFSLSAKDSDPNKLYYSRSANCVGYAAYTASTANYIFHQLGYAGWEAKPRKGKLFVGGVNVHNLFTDKALKDHDFVIFRNKDSRVEIYVDPIVYDYLHINSVSRYYGGK